jgi:pyruvate-ferredoxin/flavodoxin oxidoreductase
MVPTPSARRACLDGNEAAARVAYALSEVIAIYPITPASAMGELSDDWAAAGRPNLWGSVPEVVEMQSEGGAAGALHGALQAGALATTFTASQGLLLMVPDMFKIAGELTPAVIHVAARAIATHALSIFGDHSDAMHVRTTGWALLSSGSVQEAHDMAAVAHAATLRSRVPFLHFFDGFRTSHQVDRIELLEEEDLQALVREADIVDFRSRALTPDAPVLRGSAQNPDVFFQAREAANPFYDALPETVQEVMDELGERTGRRYGLVEYHGAPDADRVVVLMGSASGAAREAVDALNASGQHVGLLQVRLYRPFPAEQLVAALPPTVGGIAALDRTKEPGAAAEPLHLDVLAALDAHGGDAFSAPVRVIGGRYGLASKELRPEHVKAALDELQVDRPRRRFTLGIHDDVTHLSLAPDDSFRPPRPAGQVEALFYGLGSDGTVGATKSTVHIIGERTDLHAQGYFVYDSKKSGSVTASHLRFGPEPIRSTYLIDQADLVACHQFGLLERIDMLDRARPGATFLVNSPHPPDQVWEQLPCEVQEQILDKGIDVWVVDAHRIARETGMGLRINTVMQPCFFELAAVLAPDEAEACIKAAIEDTYGKLGRSVVDRNLAAVGRAIAGLTRVQVPETASSPRHLVLPVPDDAPDFVQRVTARLMAGEGDRLPVSALPPDGTFPTGTSRFEKRAIGQEIPVWDPEICIDCAKCAAVCPHATIRMKVFTPDELDGAPESFLSKDFRSKDLAGHRMTIQVAPDDCTGCGVCVDVCPAKSKTETRRKAITMEPAASHRDRERANWDFFLDIAPLDRSLLPHDTVKGSQALEPLFEFSGACAGCGETPYLKLLSQLFGDRIIVANATGCSSIYGGNLPTTPWTTDAAGRGPAWANSLFEDNAEFGFGMRLALDAEAKQAKALVRRLAPQLGQDLATALLEAEQDDEAGIATQRQRVDELRAALGPLAEAGDEAASRLLSLAGSLVTKGVWIVGGDGWAYDIGFGGLDHVLASGRNVNVLVLDTEVYSNTGGQASKATPRGAVAKFAAAGKSAVKKDLGAFARSYGNVYVAQIALGANELQATKAMLEADAWPGPSLIIAYSTCIAHGIDMATSMRHQGDAVKSGYWPVYRYQPGSEPGTQPLRIDSKAPSIPVRQFMEGEARFGMLTRSHPERAAELAAAAQADIDERWRYYSQLADIERSAPTRGSGHQETEVRIGPPSDGED